MNRYATKEPGQREDEEASRLVRPAPKKKPPRHDRRRERVQTERDQDTGSDPDLKSKDNSLNYKVIGGSMLSRVVLRHLVDQPPAPGIKTGGKGRRRQQQRRRQQKIPARSKETGEKVFITLRTLRKEPAKYEKWKPRKDETPAAPHAPGEAPDPTQTAPTQPANPQAPPAKPDEPAPASPLESKPTEGQSPATTDAPKPERGTKKPKTKDPSEGEPKSPNADSDKPKSEESEDGKKKPDKAKPQTAAEKHGIQAPKQREVSAGDKAEAALLLADHLPPKLAAQLISSGIHPDDAKTLVSDYRAARSRPMGNPTEFAAKVSKVYQTDPDKVDPPQTWRAADGKKVAFDELTPEEKASAYRQHQMQVVAVSLAAQHQLQEKLSFGNAVPKAIASSLTKALLHGSTDEETSKTAAEVFESTSESAGFSRIPEGAARQMMSALSSNEGASAILRSFLEANDYKRAKDLYLSKGVFSERDQPADIAEGLRSARDYFKVQARAYGAGGHEGAKRFETKILGRLRSLDEAKYKTVRLALDRADADEYDAAKRAWESYTKRQEAWEAKPFRKKQPEPPAEGPPVEPAGYSNARSADEAREQGRQLWDSLFERSGNKKTAAHVAAKFLVSSYLAGIPMHRSAPKRALYHGIDPGQHYPREHYPEWSQVSNRDLSEDDHEKILASAREWLGASQVEGAEADQKQREALDLALYTGPYKVDATTYEGLVARLKGSSSRAAATDRGPLERAVFNRFPSDSKSKSGGKLKVLLSGEMASKLKVADYTTTELSELSEADLESLAKLLRVRTARSSSFDQAQDANPLSRNTDNGAKQMLRLSSEQKTSANQILAAFDEVAQQIQDNHRKWGMPFEVARNLVNRLDKTADATESLIFGEGSLRARQAEIAVQSADFTDAAVADGLLTPREVSKAAKVLQRDSDESYMDTFKNPMKPIETDSDEPYMTAYSDDQSSAVVDGEDHTGRELAPEA